MPTINRPKKPQTKPKRGKNKEIAHIYNRSEWRDLRKTYMMEHPLCELCLDPNFPNLDGEKGEKITPTQEIHHKTPISHGDDELQMMDYAYNYTNLIALCRYHHHYIHRHNIIL